jgi:hypothetical protein
MPKPGALQPVSFPLVGGVDTKISRFVLPAPKLEVCENAWSDRTGSLQRRPGRTAFTTSVQSGGVSAVGNGPAATATYKDALLLFTNGATADAGRAYEYSESLVRWVDKGDVCSPRVRSQNVAKSGAEAGAWNGDSATANGISVHAYEEHEPSGANFKSSVKVTITDAAGVVLKRAYTLYTVTAATVNGTLGVKCVARANKLYVFYYDATAADLMVALFDATSAATLGTMQPTPISVAIDIDTTTPCFDVMANATHGIFVAYNDTTANRITYLFVDSAGAVVAGSTATQATATAGGPTSIAVAAGADLAMHGIAWCDGTVPNDVYALHRSWNGTTWSGLVGPSTAIDTALGADPAVNIAARYSGGGSTTLRVFYSTGTITNPIVHQGSYTTSGVINSRVATKRKSVLASKPVLAADGQLYYWVLFSPSKNRATLPTYFLYREDNFLVAQAVRGDAVFSPVSNYVLPQIERASNSYACTLAYYIGVLPTTSFAANVALRRVSFDLVHADSHASVENDEELYLAGGFLQQYDGQSFVESNFLVPLNTILVSSVKSNTATGALTAVAIYSYQLIYAWTDIRGRRCRGANLGAHTLTALGAGDDTITLTLPTLTHTRKQAPRGNVVIEVYRTLANPAADSPSYLVGQVANDPTVDTVSFVDTMSDTLAASSEQFYQGSGELENTAPPAAHIITRGNGRVLLAGFADQPNSVMASKVPVDGRALEFSDFLPGMSVPDAGGPITALAVMNESVFIFKESRIYRVQGEGPNNLGFGEFFAPQLVNTDTGTTQPRSVVVTPDGIMFEGAKGKMLLEQNLRLSYIGAPLEKLTAPGLCTGATLLPTLQQVRFSYAATTHVWDYYHRQWYVFTHGSSGLTCMQNDVLVGISASTVVREDATAWTDSGDSYIARLDLGWARDPSTLQGNLRLRAVGLTGESLAAHNLSVVFVYDYEAGSVNTIAEAIAGAGVLKRNWRVARQLANAVQIRILDFTLGGGTVAGAGFRLNELTFEFVDVRAPGMGRD